MAKGNPSIDIKKEKDKFIALLNSEAKRFDIQSMHIDLNTKIDNIVKNIGKDEKHIVDNEERQLRNLDKLDYMIQYLKEDNESTQESLQTAQNIKDKSKVEMQAFEEENQDDLDDL